MTIRFLKFLKFLYPKAFRLIPLPSAINPFLSSLSLNLSSSVAFSSTATTDFSSFDIKSADDASWKTYSSQRKFYYPSQITPVTFSASFGGTIFDYSSSKTVTKKNNEKISRRGLQITY